MSDERLKKYGTPDRGNTRAMEDRAVTQDRQITDTERRAMLRNEFLYEALPNPPKLSGFHTIWLSSAHQYDTFQQRSRLGYVPVRSDEIPGWENLKIKSGDHEGCIGVNEMILFKIPLETYQMYMEVFHHEMPAEQEGKLKEMVDQAKSLPGNLLRDVGDGMAFDSGNGTNRVPKFSE